MTNAPPRIPQQPKLRSSCDECGAAKLKCDRGQPNCGRCLSLGLLCVYGVSRKMGKRSRKRPQIPQAPSASLTAGEPAGGHDKDTNNGYPNGFSTNVHSLDALCSDLFGPLLPDFTSLEFYDGLSSNIETGPISTLGSPQLESYSTPAAQTEASQTQFDESRSFDSALLPPSGSRDHDCFREAYDILGSLSFHSLNDAHSISQSPPVSASTTASTSHSAPLDHVLRLNREASERLGHLLTCSCARSPHLTLLHASIISRVLIWYQQAAGCTQSAPWSPTAITLDTASHQVSLTGFSPGSGSGSGGGFSTWSSTAASTFNTGGAKNTPTLTQSPGLAVAPAKIAIGTFNVDDLRMQTALEIQLLLGEVRRASRLIDQFTSGGGNSLYQSLDSWLRGEHSRIANIMRSKLRELNT
ncbi:hypothetical protein K432DRAFT_364753 [Lepidopterella palustris CBS 459.81]|uniref:Zn(2)-C6 fungal-type domain-containing protein n=1 Tax=Lepidopterella palustris CBS 459.81 TaxID=1314670 RepID=A0A8E2DXV9_9PEZI|nr:hypothetical protein K432DRAFT_364753 [Lepidopterella palustris CBS 459.81]